ncbi:Flagellar transcriptional activator FlhD [Candidatus Paraburkholderia kirkii]|nr:Flagellar transcriptional activator FlhD [Candidatus Paraburkholderia kirkii]
MNLSYLLLAQRLLHEDRVSAMYRLGLSSLTLTQAVKVASSSHLLCRFRFDDHTILSSLADKDKSAALTQAHAAILLAGGRPRRADRLSGQTREADGDEERGRGSPRDHPGDRTDRAGRAPAVARSRKCIRLARRLRLRPVSAALARGQDPQGARLAQPAGARPAHRGLRPHPRPTLLRRGVYLYRLPQARNCPQSFSIECC